jgi:ubiquinone/menaquinone biosynthesis C-methylase UbiE
MNRLKVFCVAFLSSNRSTISILSETMSNLNASPDEWLAQADLYSDQSARITELHGADLVTILKDDILKAKTILDVGSGTGAFARAYLQQFPKGIPNQTLILSDLSAGMLDKAKETVKPVGDDTFQTKIVFQVEDGTKLEGIESDSIDLVVSLFGVFLIPDQEGAQKAISRVLKKKDGTFANASWMFGLSKQLSSAGFGVTLQDAFQVPIQTLDPKFTLQDQSFYQWADRNRAKSVLSDQYNLVDVQAYSALHTTVWQFENFWNMLMSNPMTNLKNCTKEDQERAKEALKAFVTSDGSKLDKPLLFSSGSIVTVGKSSSS